MENSNATKEEMWKKSILKAQNGDKEERDQIVLENRGLIYMVLKRFLNRGYDMEELFQIGVIGLLKAVDKFDVELNYAFSTYAVPMIIGEIKRFLRDDSMLHISRRIKDNAVIIASIREEILKKENRTPSVNELMGLTGMSREDVIEAIESGYMVDSLFKPVAGTEDKDAEMGRCLGECIEDKTQMEQDLIDKIAVQQLMSYLNEEERQLIELRYLKGMTQSKVAEIMDLNQVAVSRKEKGILRKLNEFLRR